MIRFLRCPLIKMASGARILMEKGTFNLEGSLTIRASGVILRGGGSRRDGTTLLGAGVGREPLIHIAGINDQRVSNAVQLEKKYFPVNALELTFPEAHSFKTGDQVIITRPSNKEWIEYIGADKIGIYVDYQLTKWEPGDFDINWGQEDKFADASKSMSLALAFCARN